MSGRPVYSHSRLACFEKCPRQFHYRYIERRKVDTESVEAFVGKRVHEVIERLNRFVERGQIPSLPKVLQRFRELWEQHFDPERIRIVRREMPPAAYRSLGEQCLSNHYHRCYPFDADESLGIEQRLTFALDAEGAYRMQGVIDRIVRASDGALEIHDYKTGRWVPSQEQLDNDRQLALYQIAVEREHGAGEPVRLVWHYLQRNQLRISTRTAAQLAALCGDTIALIDRIEAEQEFAPRPSNLCDWCEFNDVCPAVQARTPGASPDGPSAVPTPTPAAAAAAAPPSAPARQSGSDAKPPAAQLGLFARTRPPL